MLSDNLSNTKISLLYKHNLQSTDLRQETIVPEPETLEFAQSNVIPTNSEASAVFKQGSSRLVLLCSLIPSV
jgi:hypothetical protein